MNEQDLKVLNGQISTLKEQSERISNSLQEIFDISFNEGYLPIIESANQGIAGIQSVINDLENLKKFIN